MNNNLNKIKIFTFLFSLTAFVVSLTQSALTYTDFDGQKIHSSISLLFMGGLAVLGGGLLEWLIWLANPLYFIALFFFYKSNKSSKIYSIAATTLALSFSNWKVILAAENGREATIHHLNLGYWLWVLSMTVLSIGTIYYFKQLNKNNRNNHWA